MVFTIRIKQPWSVAGRVWNLAQSLLAIALPALIVLKLAGVIAWSWWWVLSPLWIGGIQLAAVLCALLALLAWGVAERKACGALRRAGGRHSGAWCS